MHSTSSNYSHVIRWEAVEFYKQSTTAFTIYMLSQLSKMVQV